MDASEVDESCVKRCAFLVESAFAVSAANPQFAAWLFAELERVATQHRIDIGETISNQYCSACHTPLFSNTTAKISLKHLRSTKRIKQHKPVANNGTQNDSKSDSLLSRSQLKRARKIESHVQVLQAKPPSKRESVRNVLVTVCYECGYKRHEMGTRTCILAKRKHSHKMVAKNILEDEVFFVDVKPTNQPAKPNLPAHTSTTTTATTTTTKTPKASEPQPEPVDNKAKERAAVFHRKRERDRVKSELAKREAQLKAVATHKPSNPQARLQNFLGSLGL